MEQSLGEAVPLLFISHSTNNPPSPTKAKRIGGILLTLLATFFYALATLILKIFETYNPLTVTIWRFQGMLIPSIPMILVIACLSSTKETGYAKTFGIGPGVHTLKKNVQIMALIVIRSFVGCTSNILQMYALDHLSLGDTSVIVFSYPVIVTFIAHCFLGEKAGWSSVLIALLTFVGVIIIARPSILTGKSRMNSDALIGVIFAVGSMLTASIAIIILRSLRFIHFSLLTLSYGILGSFQTISLAASYGVLDYPHGLEEWFLAGGLVVFTFLAQALLILALKLELAGPVALLQSTDVIFSFILQFVFLGVAPDRYSYIGAAIVIIGVSLTSIRKWMQTKTNEAAARRT